MKKIQVQVKICEDKQRIKGQKYLQTTLKDILSDEQLTELEDSIYQNAEDYIFSLRNIVGNLDPNNSINNTYLLPKILDGTIAIAEIVNMTDEEMFPARWSDIHNKRSAEAHQATKGRLVVTTSIIKCGKCGSGVSYEERQTRSCDEAMTVHVTCPSCGNKFKI